MYFWLVRSNGSSSKENVACASDINIHETNTILFTIVSDMKQVKYHPIISRVSLFDDVIYSSADADITYMLYYGVIEYISHQ